MHSAHKLNTQLAKQTSKAELHFLHSITNIVSLTQTRVKTNVSEFSKQINLFTNHNLSFKLKF